MRKILLILTFLIASLDATAALRVGAGTKTPNITSSNRNAPATATTTTQNSARTARSRAATQTPTPIKTTSTGTRTTTTITSAPSDGRNASVTSRAAKQSVVTNSTKITAAAQNTVVDEKCWNGFMGCMDSFCMLDNANGGRCICSDKNAEYDSILAQIQDLDEQSYQLATVGVERIEMGDAANEITKKTQEITKGIEKDSAQSKRKSLDLSAWDINEIDFDADATDIFSLSSDGASILNKTGDALYRAAAKLCNTQLPECKSQSTMMELMYKQRIRSDCTAYENSLRQSRTQSAQKLATAQSAMREAALEQYRNANKYDLGQCTVQFKQCMQTTGGCGEDFSGCVDYSVRESLTGNRIQTKTIKGTSSKIQLLTSTYDILESKKELCMTVTQQCVNVRDQVWDTFLREVAPQVKSAELMVESNMRTSCISNIANCFQKACKENMDPNDPDGSYDMCLTRPDTLESACKVEIDPCKGAIPNIMDYVKDRLFSMRVDSCTKEFKQCLTSEDRCGADYTQCVGLDTDTIVKMCPADKLPGCKYGEAAHNGDYVYKESDVYENLSKIATGIFLNIDNNMLATCQKALDTAMLRVCGSTENCDELAVDNGAGTRSFKYEVCQYKPRTTSSTSNTVHNGGLFGRGATPGNNNNDSSVELEEFVCRASLDSFSKEEIKDSTKPLIGKLSGLVYWGNISYTDNNNTITFTDVDTYINQLRTQLESSNLILSDEDEKVIRDRVFGTEISALKNAVENAITTIESDQVVQYCMTGREFRGYQQTLGSESKTNPRFPSLTRQIRRMIADSALKNVRDNYMQKYDSEMERMMKDQVKAAQITDEENAKTKAMNMCIAYGNSGTMPMTDGPKASNLGKWIVAGVLILGGIALAVFTGGTSVAATVGGIAMITTTIETGIIAGAAVGVTGAAVGISAANNPAAGGIKATSTTGTEGNIGYSESTQWNYKETIKTIPAYETGVCTVIKTTTKCAKIKQDYCKEWEDEVEETTTINLLN